MKLDKRKMNTLNKVKTLEVIKETEIEKVVEKQKENLKKSCQYII